MVISFDGTQEMKREIIRKETGMCFFIMCLVGSCVLVDKFFVNLFGKIRKLQIAAGIGYFSVVIQFDFSQ